MSYTVLARKYRSQTFDDVIGQEAISQTLKNAIKSDRVAHAYLFTGTRGTGKTTMARILAKALNCLEFDKPTTQPCCKCQSCIAVNAGDDIDVIEIDGASNNSVDNIRELRENAIYKPARARYKIYIIDEVHMLSTSAFNALLKILEEPPEHVKFIFATTDPNKVIPTIQSRCQRFDFRNIPPLEIAKQLKRILEHEKIKFDDDLILPLAKLAEGSMRDALSLLDRLISTGEEPLRLKLLQEYLGCPDEEKINSFVEAIGNCDPAASLAMVEELVNSGLGEVQILDLLVDNMRDLMVIKSAGAKTELLILNEEQRSRAAKLAEKFDIAALIYNITTLEKLRWSIKNSEKGRTLLEAAVLRLALSEHFINVDSLLSGSNNISTDALKKNIISTPTVSREPLPQPATMPSHSPDTELTSDEPNDQKWQQFLNFAEGKLDGAVKVILVKAAASGFDGDEIKIIFSSAGEVAKKVCLGNGRKDHLEKLLSEFCGRNMKASFIVQNGGENAAQADKRKSSSVKHNEVMQEPAIRDLITELGATITGIEEQ